MSAPWHKSEGYVKVLSLENNMWYPMGQTLRGNANDYFGSSLSLAPDANRIDFTHDDVFGENVEIFEYDGKSWVQKGYALAASGGESYCGSSILSSDGDCIAVGSVVNYGTFDKGRVGVFRLS